MSSTRGTCSASRFNPVSIVNSYRKAGNRNFQRYKTSPYLDWKDKKSLLSQALASYDNAEGVEFPDHLKSAEAECKKLVMKNKGVIYFVLADLEKLKSTRLACYNNAATFLSKAFWHAEQIEKGHDGEDQSLWLAELVNVASRLSQSFQIMIEDFKTKEKLDAYEVFILKLDGSNFIKLNDFGEMIAQEWMTLAQLRMGEVADEVQAENYKSALAILGDIYRPIEEAKKNTQVGSELKKECKILTVESVNYVAMAESMQALSIGKQYLDQAIANLTEDESETGWSSNWKSDKLAFQAMDMFREASNLSKGLDVELFCQGLLLVGTAFYRVFQAKYRAKICFKEAMDIANTVEGNMFTRKWYNDLVAIMTEIRDVEVAVEEAKWENMRKPYLDELKDELSCLEKLNRVSFDKFVTYIFKNHLPIHKEKSTMTEAFEKYKDADDSQKKKLLVKIITYYHPDKISKEEYGMKYVVLCEEISKILTNKYGCLKGVE